MTDTTTPAAAHDPTSTGGREAPPAAVAALLSRTLVSVDAAASRLTAAYVASPTFSNPAGHVQGGMLSAMLDDLTALVIDLGLADGESPATLNLNVSFLRPALPGDVSGEAWVVKRGRSVCHAAAELRQDGKTVATATATCSVVRTGKA